MSLINTINFLPEVFRTPTNQRFLGATLDQLYQPDQNFPINGYIGRTLSPTYKADDNYLPESSNERKNYQLEASVVVTDDKKNIVFNTGYIDLLHGIRNYGGLTNNQQRLFSSKSYSYDGHFDYDKFINYYDYYWLPDGPDPVEISANDVPYRNTYKVTRNTSVGGYVFTGTGTHPNVQLTLARGGVYTFDIDQPGHKFWIQSLPGISGLNPNVPTLSTRQIFGVTNNGIDSGQITFRVPLSSAQDFYTAMPITATVNAAVSMHYTDIQNQLLSTFLTNFPTGLDGISNPSLLQNTAFIFINNDKDAVYWTTPNVPSSFVGDDTSSVRPGDVIPSATIEQGYPTNRASVWKVNLVPTNTNDYVIQISSETAISSLEKVFIGSGQVNASKQFWLDKNLQYQPVPIVTAISDYIYYQDESDPTFFGQIKLVDNLTSTIDVTEDIIGKTAYTSPNGIIFTNGLKIEFDTTVIPVDYVGSNGYYVEGVGSSIQLVRVDDLIVPESFGENIDTVVDYITINRASQDQNPWTRYNRWFHKDAILATAIYNNTSANYGPNLPARRPIVEFEPNLKLFQTGYIAKDIVSYITFTASDAFNDVEGEATAQVDGYTLVSGDTIIFANDYDTNVRFNIYEVVPVQITGLGTYLTLVKTANNPVLANEMVLVNKGSQSGRSFVYSGTSWSQCQDKTDVNQEPLFDLVDAAGYSFSDTTKYPDSTFAGTQFFGYAHGSGNNDNLLGFPLSYRTFNNIGDIIFKNHYDLDSFTYIFNRETITVECQTGYLLKITDGTSKLNNWVENIENTTQPQVFTHFFDGKIITIDGVEKAFVQVDVLPTSEKTIPHVKVYINNKLLSSRDTYELVKYGIYDIIIFSSMLSVGDKIDIEIQSDQVSKSGYYKIPANLDLNPLNENLQSITLGQLRTHYNALIENTAISPTGSIPVQDSYLKRQSGTLLQHNASLIYAMAFLNDPDINFVSGLDLARKEYTKFKNKFLSLCSTIAGLDYTDSAGSVDKILSNINAIKNSSFPWYYSDMVPQGDNYIETKYSVLNLRQTTYEINSIFNTAQLSNRAVLIYVNDVQQTLGVNYTFSTITPTVIFTSGYSVGTKIVIRDYANTDGNYIPETPTKLGLYPKFNPIIYLDTTYQTPINVIRGHDGSITPEFGDFRDQFLLELETRIFNNIKSDYTKNQISKHDIIPGRFRSTSYSLAEYNRILSRNFLVWVGNNQVDYQTNKSYDVNNSWTWNYRGTSDIIDGSALQGSWRAVYNYWFDTDSPHLRPWEMLGYELKPSWWETRYGPSPYTKGNTLLWSDLENGYVWNDNEPYYDKRFARPNLSKFIPVDTGGNLISPASVPLITQQNTAGTSSKFTVGQYGPAETAWRNSSDYPYALQMVLALTSPATYFSTQLDTNKFSISELTGQFTTSDNQKINPNLLQVNGNLQSGTIQRTSGYINWIGDFIKNLGIDPAEKLMGYFSRFTIQLSYKVGGFTDNKLITISAEQTSPGSTSPSIIIPDTNFNIYLNKSVPTRSVAYSAVIVEKTINGYSVSGYDPTFPFFTVNPSILNNKNEVITVNNLSAKIYQEAVSTLFTVPYGTEYTSTQQVVDFLISYERYLKLLGFVFAEFNNDLQEEQNWRLSVKELLYWAQQGWANGTIVVLNPIATKLSLVSVGMIVDEITNLPAGNKILDQNFIPIKSNNFNITRVDSPAQGNTFLLNTLDDSTICYARLNLIQYEHVLIFDNTTDFSDIIYIPSQGTRQFRLKLRGYKSGAWTGALSAPGYVYNNPILDAWDPSKDYRIGDLVVYNTNYYTAIQDIPATVTFNSIAWSQIPKSEIQTGLLQNFSLNAQQFDNIYDIDRPPGNEIFQEFSAGLIGFRQRQYLTDLGISIPTQTKFYQGYIKEKGSMNSITALTSANFNNVNGNIAIYEEWALKVGAYGGIHSNLFSEYVLDQSVFKNNSVVALAIADTYSTGNIIANLTLANVYNASNLYSTSNSLYNNRDIDYHMADLPSTGYANLSDIDYTIFDLTKFSGSIKTLGVGTKVWVAKKADNNWDIMRVTETRTLVTKLSYSLDSNAILTFDRKHPFTIDDPLVLKYFHPRFDGIFTVIGTPTPLTVLIAISNVQLLTGQPSPLQYLIRAGSITAAGTAYSLKSARTSSLSTLANTAPPTNGWLENDKIWVDNATSSGWEVYSFNTPWIRTNPELQYNETSGTELGKSVRISSDSKYVYVGNPGNNKVYIDAVIPGTATSANLTSSEIGFGTTIDSRGNLLAISSHANVILYQHRSNTISNTQTLSSANVSGNISSISIGGNILCIGGNNIVEVWRTSSFTFLRMVAATISGTSNAVVFVGNVIQQDNSGAAGIVVSASSGNIITLRDVVGTFTTNSADILRRLYANLAVAANLETRVTTINSYQADSQWANVLYKWATKISSPATGTDPKFGNLVKVTNDGTTLFVGAAGATVDSIVGAGNVYVYSITNSNTATLSQTISAQNKNQLCAFGTGFDTDSTGNLFIGAPGTLTSGYIGGAVERHILNTSTSEYEFNQSLGHPNNDIGNFGISIGTNQDSKSVVIGSVGSSANQDTIFDNSLTTIDTMTTNFVDHVFGAGAAYIFEPLIDSTIINTVGRYVYTQQLESQLFTNDQYGTTVDVAGNVMVVGAPGHDERFANLKIKTENSGTFYVFNNLTGLPAWNKIRSQQPRVDINSIGQTLLYDKTNNNILAALDYIDPAKGKILNFVAEDIDYQQPIDPAAYNVGPTAFCSDYHWGPQQIGKIWWNLDTVRYVDYEQDSLIYRLNNWGELFPGSSIDVYQWIESNVRPSQYVVNGGEGTPLYATDSTSRYSTYGYVSDTGAVKVKYYYWVTGLGNVDAYAGKHNSIIGLTNAIKNPQNQNIPYATVLQNNSVALYNISNFLTGKNSVIHFTSRHENANLVHSEYALVQEGNAGSKIPPSILAKLIDSIAGIDTAGNIVPDPALLVSQRYGLSIRPRQTMVINKDLALLNYLTLVNSYLLVYPVVDRKILTTLNAEEAIPIAGANEWDIIVANIDELTYINKIPLSAGYKVLVTNDITKQNKWTIYTLNSNENFVLSQTQSYKTNLYWTYANWYDSEYDPTSTPDVTVDNVLDLGKLTLSPDIYILVLDAGNGKFAIYYVNSNLSLDLVGLEDGTIQINNDTIPGLELRNILLGIQEDILIDDLADKFNKVFFTIIKYILSEQKNLDWVFKTSFITATQHIRKLEEFPSYIPDNQDFYQSYIEEVKPYRSVIREFIVNYIGDDTYGSDITDFDLPAYWDSAMQVYRSPSGEQSYDSTLLTSALKYSQWNANYTYKVVNIIIEDAGSGYLTPPQVIIEGAAASGAAAYSVIDANGSITNIIITDPGKNYTTTPTITINGACTTIARVQAVLRNIYDNTNTGHNVVRSIRTNIKFDRTTYTNPNTFVFWDSLGNANIGQVVGTNSIIVIQDKLYKLSNTHTISANITFPISYVSTISANTFTNASDRIIAFNGNIDLKLTTPGIAYPGVIVDGNTVAGGTIDSIISSQYTDTLGVDPSEIIVDGGGYITVFSSHAPEELVPGCMFDSLTIKVFSNVSPGTNDYAFRIFSGMADTDNRFYRIATANTTTLSSNLTLLANTIHVTSATKLPSPNPTLAIPGIVYINSEKIAYYTNYAKETIVPWTANLLVETGSLVSYGNLANIVLTNGNVQSNTYITSGNVYHQTFANISANLELININSLGRIRRAVNGTSPSSVHTANSRVVDSGIMQEIPYSASYQSNIGSANVTYTSTGNVSLKLQVTSNITANIGDYITQRFGNAVVSANLKVLSNVVSATNIAVIKISGTVTNLSGNTIRINGTINSANVIGQPTILGTVNSAGNVTVTANTQLTKANAWYTLGGSTPSDGTGLVNSVTAQAIFLKASPGYTPG